MSNKANNYQQHLMKTLKDPELAVEYLNTALEEEVEDPTLFLRTLKNVAEAWGFDLTGLDRAGIYKILSQSGNPRLSSLHSLLDAMGLKLAIVQKSEAT
jgi:probable addiction module antidote protein